VPTVVRKLPVSKASAVVTPLQPLFPTEPMPVKAATTELARQSSDIWVRATSPAPAVLAPLAPGRYKIQFTASQDTYDKLQRARALLRHVVPNGDPAAVFDRALDVLLAQLERRKMATTHRPRLQPTAASHSRHIPAAVRREVWQRDGARCAFVGTGGRCDERGFLELHHVVPFADGGKATAENIQLRCRAHNAYEAELHFGSFLVREETVAYDSVQTEFVAWHELRAIADSRLVRLSTRA
jgi:5-methylcytosine-specific restriction endonuclease McrA